MAAPQFFSPPKVKPSRPTRRFTLREATRALPLVSRIVADVVRVHAEAGDVQARLDAMGKKSSDAKTAVERELGAKLDRLQTLGDELQQIGVELKDYEIGLIDFIGRHQGRDVYLCWKAGEERIGYWHELHSGYAGRQPISVLEENE